MQLGLRHSQFLTIIIILSVLLPGLLLFGSRESVFFDNGRWVQPEPAKTDKTVERTDAILPTAATSSVVKFLFFGDLMLDRHIGEKLKGKNVAVLLSGLNGEENHFWSGIDLVGANLEGAVTDGGEHYSPTMAYDFSFTPERIAELKQYGFNFFNLANNHISDQGNRGLKETRVNLSKRDFNFSGDVDATVSPESLKIVDIGERKIALIGLSMVYHDFDLTQAEKLVSEAKVQSDLVVINIHWGTEYQHQFSRHQQTVGRALVAAGADVVIGHHPHVVQGMEIYQGRPIFYSLGNFIFDQYFSPDTQQGLAVGLNIDKDKILISLFPLQAKSAAVSLMSGDDKSEFLDKYSLWSEKNDGLRAQINQQSIEIIR